jgi:hypothetical protein
LLTADTVGYASITAVRALTAEERARVFLETPTSPSPTRLVADPPQQNVTGMTVEQLRAAAVGGNPYAHRRLGELYERGEGVEVNLERALFHHAIGVRLFEEAGNEDEAQLARARRGSIARALSPGVTARIASEALDWRRREELKPR